MSILSLIFTYLSLIFIIFIFVYTYNKPVHSFSLLLVFYLIIPPSVAFPISFLGIHLVLSLPRIYLIGVILAFISSWLTGRLKVKFIKSSSEKVLIFFIFYLLISLSWGINLSFDLKLLFSEQWFLGFMGYFIAMNIFTNQKALWFLFKKIFVSIIVLSVYGFIEILTQRTITDLPIIRSMTGLDLENSKYIPKTIGERGGFARASGTFWNTIIYGLALTLFFPYFMIIRKTVNSMLLKWTFLISSIGGLLTISRTAWFSIIYAVGLNFRKNKVLFISILIVFFVFLLPFLNREFNRVGYIDKTGLNIESRLVALRPVLNELNLQKFLGGFGIGSYIFSIQEINTINITRLPGDNTFAQRIFTTGIIGVFIFLFFFLCYYRNLIKNTDKNNSFSSSVIKATKQMIIIQLTLFFVSNSLFQDTRLSFVFFSVLGAVKGTIKSKN